VAQLRRIGKYFPTGFSGVAGPRTRVRGQGGYEEIVIRPGDAERESRELDECAGRIDDGGRGSVGDVKDQTDMHVGTKCAVFGLLTRILSDDRTRPLIVVRTADPRSLSI